MYNVSCILYVLQQMFLLFIVYGEILSGQTSYKQEAVFRENAIFNDVAEYIAIWSVNETFMGVGKMSWSK